MWWQQWSSFSLKQVHVDVTKWRTSVKSSFLQLPACKNSKFRVVDVNLNHFRTVPEGGYLKINVPISATDQMIPTYFTK